MDKIVELLNDEINRLQLFLEELKNETFSAVVTGSVARNDVRVENDTLISDLDILIFVSDYSNIKILKKNLSLYVSYNNIAVNLMITDVSILEQEENFGRGYIQDLINGKILFDGLCIRNKIEKWKNNKSYTFEKKIREKGIFQKIGYYYAKSLFKPNEKCKFESACSQLDEIIYDIDRLREYIKRNNVDILSSTQLALFEQDKYTNNKDFYEAVRDKVFIENQGFTYKDSYIEIRK